MLQHKITITKDNKKGRPLHQCLIKQIYLSASNLQIVSEALVIYPPDPAAMRSISETDLNLVSVSNVPSESLMRTSSPVQQKTKQQTKMKLCSGTCCYSSTDEEIIGFFYFIKKYHL